MAYADDEPFLTTRQVAERCGISESTVRYSARVGNLRGMKVRNSWRFPESEARGFCDDLHREKAARRRRRRRPLVGWMRWTGSKSVWLLNFTASLIAVVTAFGPAFMPVVGFALAGVNAVLGVVTFGLWRRRRASAEDVVSDQPVDPDAVGWRRARVHHRDDWDDPEDDAPDPGDIPTGAGALQTMVVLSLFGVAFYASGALADGAWDEQQDGIGDTNLNRMSFPLVTDTPAPTVTATATWTPAPGPPLARISGGGQVDPPLVNARDSGNDPPLPGATDTPTPTATLTPTDTPTPTFTPTPTEIAPATCDVDGCPDGGGSDGGFEIPNPDEGVPADPNQPALDVPAPTPTLPDVD